MAAAPAPSSNPPFFTIDRALAIIGALSIVFSIIALRWKRKLPCYAVLANNLLRDHTARLPALDVRFSGVPVQSLTVARVAIWNAGREPIRGNDVATTDPLILAAPDTVRILDARVIQSTSAPSAMNLVPEGPNVTSVTFEFLNHRQGSVIEVVHTGTRADDLTVKGSIQGASPIRRINVAEQARKVGFLTRRRQTFASYIREMLFICLITGIFFAGLVALMAWGNKNPLSLMQFARVLGIAFLTVSCILGFSVLMQLLGAAGPLPRGLHRIAEGLFDD